MEIEGNKYYVNFVNKRMGSINLGITFPSIYNLLQGNKRKFLEGNSNFFWQEVKNIMGNNTVICSCHHDDILSFNYLGKCLYQGYYHMVSFSGLLYCMNAVSSEADEKYIQKVLKDNLKLTMILEFFLSTFTFNIWIELAIIPITTIITVMNVMAERKEEYKDVHKLLDFVLAIAGFWILYETIKVGITEYKNLNVINTLVSFMIPIVYLVLIIPLEYVLELYSKYELLFLRMTFKEEKDKRTKIKHRIDVLCACRFSVRRVLLFQRKYMSRMYIRMKDNEFKQLIREFKNECKR